jgi:outer membrane protein OmpA-like peptidoglycan-associated protein
MLLVFQEIIMAEDWIVDVRKYAANVDENVVQAIVRYCGIALQSRDGQLVAMSDKKERELVRENYLKKKLGLTASDESLDADVLAVGEQMKADRTKNRVTVYYLLAERLGALGVFGGVAGAAGAVAAGAAGAVAAAVGGGDDEAADKSSSVAPLAAAAGLAGAGAAAVSGAASTVGGAVSSAASGAVNVASNVASGAADAVSGVAGAATGAVAGAAGLAAGALSGATGAVTGAAGAVGDAVSAPLSAVRAGFDDEDASGGGIWGWLKWVLLALLLLALVFFLMRSCSGDATAPVADGEKVEATAGETADAEPAKAEPEAAAEPAAVPTGSGVVASERDGKPMLTVYFDTAKTNLPTDFDKVAAVIKDYAAKNADAKFAVSGFNSPTGSAAGNERLSKGRAENVGAALQKLGVSAGAVELVKPVAATQGTGEDSQARRVEVTVK